jgi:arylsulfatase
MPNVKEDLLKGYKAANGITYKVHIDGYNNLDHWMGKSKSARREFYYYDETDLMAIRVDSWKMHIGVKREGSWFNDKYYPSVPYLFNLLMDPMEKMDPESSEWGAAGRKFLAQKLWAPTAAGPFLAAHLQSMKEYPPSQGADTLSMHKAIESAMAKLNSPHGSSN